MAVQRLIRVPMSDREKIATGTELAEQEVAWKAAEDERAARRAELNENVRLHRDRVRELAKSLMDGHVDRLVDCEWQIDFLQSQRRLVRLDTMEIVQTALLTPEERKLAIAQNGMELLLKEVERTDPGPTPNPDAVELDNPVPPEVDPDQEELPLGEAMDDQDMDAGDGMEPDTGTED